MASSNPLYDLVGGYYPGEPIPKKTGKKDFADPVEFDTGAVVDEYLEGIRRDIKDVNPSEISKGFFIKDLERALVAQASPKSGQYNVDRALELGDEEQLSGVQVQLDINPFKWAKDPKKMLQQTGSQMWKDFFNWSDYNVNLEQTGLWNPLLKGEENKLNPLERWAFSDDRIPEKEPGPFQMEGMDVFTTKREAVETGEASPAENYTRDEYAKIQGIAPNDVDLLDFYANREEYFADRKVDLFRKAGTEFKKLHVNSRASGARPGNFESFTTKTSNASAAEFWKLIQEGKITDPQQLDNAQKFIHRAKVQRAVSGISGGNDFDVYVMDPAALIKPKTAAEKDLVWNGAWMGTRTGTKLTSVALGGYLHGLEKKRVDDKSKQDTTSITNKGTVEFYLGGFFGKLDKDGNKITDVFEAPGALEIASRHISDGKSFFKKRVDKAVNAGNKSAEALARKELASFLDDIKPAEKYISSMRKIERSLTKRKPTKEELASGRTAQLYTIANGKDAKRIKSQIDSEVQAFTGTTFAPGPRMNMTTKHLENHLIGGEAQQVAFENEHVIGTKRAINVAEAGQGVYRRNHDYDQVSKFIDDGFIGIAADYGRQYLRAQLDGTTPAKWASELLKRTHYFGLVYDVNYAVDSDVVGKYRKSNWGKRVEKIMDSRIFANEQSIKVILGGSEKLLEITGSRDLTIALDLFERVVNKKIGGDLKLDMKNLVHLLNGEVGLLSATGKFMGFMGYSGIDDGYNDLEAILERAKGFREWVAENAKGMGIEFDAAGKFVNNPKNLERLKALLSGLKEREDDNNYITLQQARAGLLQKFSSKVNLAREWLYKKIPISKKLQQFATWRETAARFFAKAVREAVSVAVISATGGIGALLKPILKPLLKAVEWVVRKLVAYTILAFEKVVKAIKEMDPTIFIDFIEKTGKRLGEVAFLGAALISLYLFLVAYLPVMAKSKIMLASMSPVDHTRSVYFDDGGGSAGTTFLCPPGTCTVVESAGCFKRVGENWPDDAAEMIDIAMNTLNDNFGNFVNKLCSSYDNDIEISWQAEKVACGQASTTATVPGVMRFGKGQCWSYDTRDQNTVSTFIFLLAHEAGHLYQAANPEVNALVASAQLDDCGSLKTYKGGSDKECSTRMAIYEDFAEVVGNFVAPHAHCPGVPSAGADASDSEKTAAYEEFWHGTWRGGSCTYDAHFDIADEIFNTP